jgi:hypothetical protein
MKNDGVKEAKSSPSNLKTGKIKQVFFWGLLVIMPLVIIELLSYSYIKLVIGKKTYRANLNKMSHADGVENPFHPYLGYVHAPNITMGMTKGTSRKMKLTTDENGFSITPTFAFANPDFTIITTGGSTIFGVGSSDNSTTVPSILEQLIYQRLKLRAEVVNLALRGAQSFQEMLLLDRFFAEYRADLVLTISGRNDADAALRDPTVEGAFLKPPVWNNAVPLVHKAERGEFMVIGLQGKLRSLAYTYDLLYRWLGPSKKSKSTVKTPKLNLRREASTDTKQRAKISVTHFAVADQISKINGATFVMILQPTIFGKNTWTEVEKDRMKRKGKKRGFGNWKKYRQNEEDFYDALRKIEKPFHFIDLSNVFLESNETLYVDHCHYNDLAAEKLAEKIFESIEPLLLKINAR